MNDIDSNYKEILGKIEHGQIKMKSRWYFVLRTFLTIFLLLTFLLLSFFLFSFLFFAIKQTGLWFIPAFGIVAMLEIVKAIPWLLVIIAIINLVLALKLLRNYELSYKKPLVYSILIVTALAIVGSSFLTLSGIHRHFVENNNPRNPSLAGNLYRRYTMHHPTDKITVGTIIEFVPTGFRLQDPEDEYIYVNILPETQFPDRVVFMEGDHVVVLGKRYNQNITAIGVRKIPENLIYLPRRHK